MKVSNGTAILQERSEVHGGLRVDSNLSAVMLADGCWYAVEDDPTLPEGPTGYLSFLQYQYVGGDPNRRETVMVNVDVRDIRAVAYFGMPQVGR